jgi:hypothetical protein
MGNERAKCCKECEGSAFATIPRKSNAKSVEGLGICNHGRIKNTCKECGGSGIHDSWKKCDDNMGECVGAVLYP